MRGMNNHCSIELYSNIFNIKRNSHIIYIGVIARARGSLAVIYLLVVSPYYIAVGRQPRDISASKCMAFAPVSSRNMVARFRERDQSSAHTYIIYPIPILK